MIKLAITVNAWLDEQLLFAQQLGAEQIMALITPSELTQPDGAKASLEAMRNRVEKAGFELLGLDGSLLPLHQVIQGNPGRDEEIRLTRNLIANAGAAGIHLVSYRWDDPLQRWENLVYFLEGVIPAAEKTAVRLAGRITLPSLLLDWTRLIEEKHPGCVQDPQNGLDLDLLALGGHQNGSALLDKLQQANLCERLFLISLDQFLQEPSMNGRGSGDLANRVDLIQGLKILHQAGCAACLRAGCKNAPGDADYQELAYISGYLRAALQTLNHT